MPDKIKPLLLSLRSVNGEIAKWQSSSWQGSTEDLTLSLINLNDKLNRLLEDGL